MTEWKVSRNVDIFEVWRQVRPLEPGEPMHSGVRESQGLFKTKAEAQQYADELNGVRRVQIDGKENT